jgi:hypothetical protein
MVSTAEWAAYDRFPEVGREQATVDHAAGEGARDDDGDGIGEVHDNPLEGIGTGLRNSLRRSPGVNTTSLAQYVAVFRWSDNKGGDGRVPASTAGCPEATSIAAHEPRVSSDILAFQQHDPVVG